MSLLARVLRIEQRRGLDRPTHVGVWIKLPGESSDAAMARAAASGFVSVGLLAPPEIPIGPLWDAAVLAQEKYLAQLIAHHAARRAETSSTGKDA